jgi:sortase B
LLFAACNQYDVADTPIVEAPPEIISPVVSSDTVISNITFLEEDEGDKIPEEPVIRDEFIALREQYDNDDIIGYLKIAGTEIDYLVVHTTDNEFYLDHDIYQAEDPAGWIFMDFENNIDRQDRNIIIYGHNMKNGSMFHNMRYFIDEEYFREHPTIIFNTIYADYEWEIFTFFRTHIDFQYTQVFFPTEEHYFALASEMKARSMYDTGVEISPDDIILTLSTCSGGNKAERFVLSARLITER